MLEGRGFLNGRVLNRRDCCIVIYIYDQNFRLELCSPLTLMWSRAELHIAEKFNYFPLMYMCTNHALAIGNDTDLQYKYFKHFLAAWPRKTRIHSADAGRLHTEIW